MDLIVICFLLPAVDFTANHMIELLNFSCQVYAYN